MIRAAAKTWLRRTGLLAAALAVAWLAAPPDTGSPAYSEAVYSAEGDLLSARVADDGQWRMRASTAALDPRYVTAVQLFEDESFRWHPGVNPLSILRALRQNLRAGRVVSGGSTLTMQVARALRGPRSRTLGAKLAELAWALRLEAHLSKDQILELYAARAPFGGNVVGIEAAARRYYGRAPRHFSWGEAAALAVLPNAPGLIYPGRAEGAFRRKRDRLLDKLHDRGHLDGHELGLAKAEPLPGRPHRLPQLAPHYLDAVASGAVPSTWTGAGEDGRSNATDALAEARFGGSLEDRSPGTTIPRSSLLAELQRRVTLAVERQHERTRGNGVHHAAAVVLDVHTGRPLAYVGNTACREPGSGGGEAVDLVRARRSSGSLLKPFLFAALLDAGIISPRTLVADIPTQIAGYAPLNFDRGFDGAVPAGEALTRSLNVPHVRLLQAYGVAPFLEQLRAAGFATLDRPAEDYGLSLVLGGGEVRLLDVAEAYRRLALRASGAPTETPASAAAAYLTLETLTELARPGDLAAWRSFAGGRRVAWKTGTSFGHRDAWAVGVTPDYVVAVWTGNASGEGRPGLTGASTAAPLLFDIFDALPPTGWFAAPVAEMGEVVLCRASGLRAAAACPERDTALTTLRGERLAVCTYHERVWVNTLGRRVDAGCTDLASARDTVQFELPPAWAHYRRRRHAGSLAGIPWAPECVDASSAPVMALVYPRGGRRLSVVRGLDGTPEPIVFEVAHRRTDARLHGYLDGRYLGEASGVAGAHQWRLTPAPSAHVFVAVDERGQELRCGFSVDGG